MSILTPLSPYLQSLPDPFRLLQLLCHMCPCQHAATTSTRISSLVIRYVFIHRVLSLFVLLSSILSYLRQLFLNRIVAFGALSTACPLRAHYVCVDGNGAGYYHLITSYYVCRDRGKSLPFHPSSKCFRILIYLLIMYTDLDMHTYCVLCAVSESHASCFDSPTTPTQRAIYPPLASIS